MSTGSSIQIRIYSATWRVHRAVPQVSPDLVLNFHVVVSLMLSCGRAGTDIKTFLLSGGLVLCLVSSPSLSTENSLSLPSSVLQVLLSSPGGAEISLQLPAASNKLPRPLWCDLTLRSKGAGTRCCLCGEGKGSRSSEGVASSTPTGQHTAKAMKSAAWPTMQKATAVHPRVTKSLEKGFRVRYIWSSTKDDTRDNVDFAQAAAASLGDSTDSWAGAPLFGLPSSFLEFGSLSWETSVNPAAGKSSINVGCCTLVEFVATSCGNCATAIAFCLCIPAEPTELTASLYSSLMGAPLSKSFKLARSSVFSSERQEAGAEMEAARA